MNDVDSVFVWFILIAALARSKQRLTGPPGQATALTLLTPDTVVEPLDGVRLRAFRYAMSGIP